jgi:tRNA pseudouridine synthase 10
MRRLKNVDPVDKAIEVLSKYPLCDRCLGRLFARLGYGWTNKERGDAIKRLVVMRFHERILKNDPEAKELFIKIAPNIGEQASGLYKLLTGKELEIRRCYICGNRLDEFIKEKAKEALTLLKAYDIDKFVVGVKVEKDIIEAEESLRREFGLEYGESIKSEIRREIGKMIQSLDPQRRAYFEAPQATVLVHFPSGEIEINVNSLLLAGRYWKIGRMISQAYWPTPQGPKYYSIEQALWPLMRITGGERVVLHAAGREDVDARMLGTGRPAIVEVKAPRRRKFDNEKAEEMVFKESKGFVKVKICGTARRRDITMYKEESSLHRKFYKALIVSEEPLRQEELEKLSQELRDRIIMQRTPLRVLHRRPDILRRKKVYEVSCTLLSDNIAECLIEAEGGLYIKELVDGDEGRTTPSFKEILNKDVRCIELDVVGVEGPSFIC